MTKWELPEGKLKRYPQFDAVIDADQAIAYVTDPALVASHKFFPFIEYEVSWTRFAPKGELGKPKVRRIRYAARRDSYIFSYYRHLLSERYEAQLKALGLEDCVLAYRKILTTRGRGKCNVHFAQDAFEAMRSMKNCAVIALDVSSFFEHLDHKRLWDVWRRALGVTRLPPDHFAVFKNITNYSYVMKIDAYRRLNLFGVRKILPNGRKIEGYLVPHKKIPKQLCRASDFRKKIAGSETLPSIIKRNTNPYGIPQGAPLSDLLANMYMIDFDRDMNEFVKAEGGRYFRYSDDILIIVPSANKKKAIQWMRLASKQISRYGDKLEIKESKATVHTIKRTKAAINCSRVFGTQAKNGVEYLGLRFDGTRIYLRDSTLSNLQRKIVRVARAMAYRHAKRYPNRSREELIDSFDYSSFIRRFGRVEDFSKFADDKTRWTFWTYANKAARIVGRDGKYIRRQLRRYEENIRGRLRREIATAAGRR